MDASTERGDHFVRAVERGLSVIRAFDRAHPTRSLGEVAEATGLDRATARRLLLTLRDLGYVRPSGREFTLTPRVLQLGYSYLSGLSLVDVAMPHLQSIAHELGETSSLTILDGDDIVYVALAASSRISAVQISVGTRFRAHATSMGRVLLSGLPNEEIEEYLHRLESERRQERTVRSIDELREEILKTAERGWATVDQELEEGLRGVAAPIHDKSGRVVAALNVSAHAARKTIADLTEAYVPAILAAVQRIESELVAYRP